jgi:hypothetical protein
MYIVLPPCVEQNVQVDVSWAFVDKLNATQVVLDGLEKI